MTARRRDVRVMRKERGDKIGSKDESDTEVEQEKYNQADWD